MTEYAASWSGGKDSCFAYWKAISQGLKVSHLLNFINVDSTKAMSHGLDSKLIAIFLDLGQKIFDHGFRRKHLLADPKEPDLSFSQPPVKRAFGKTGSLRKPINSLWHGNSVFHLEHLTLQIITQSACVVKVKKKNDAKNNDLPSRL